FVNGLRLDAPIGVQPDLMNIGERSEEGIRKTAAKSAWHLERNGNGNRGLHHEIPGALSRKVQHCRLAREETTFGSAHDRGEAAVAPGFDALVAEADFISGAAPRRGTGAILRSTGLFLRATRAAFTTGRGGSDRNANISECIHEAGIDDQPLA